MFANAESHRYICDNTATQSACGRDNYRSNTPASRLQVEESLLGQASSESRADQWRVAALGGYSRAPTAGGTPLGWEAALRLGFFRGSNGNVIPAGGLFGAKLAFPMIRLTSERDPWERADLLDTSVWMLVPEFGINSLVSRSQGVQPEATAVLALRLYFSTTLVP